jgi:hypothetical protein
MTSMSLFSSDRERRLWVWALLTVVAIYSTLGLQGKLAASLRDLDMLVNSYILFLILLIFAILGSGLKRQIGRYEIWVTLGIIAVYGMLMVRLFLSPEERTHLFEYGLVGVLIFQALAERKRHARQNWAPAVIAIVVTALLGWLDEGIQVILPNRVFDIRDVGFNALAGLMAILASLLLAWAKNFRRNVQTD